MMLLAGILLLTCRLECTHRAEKKKGKKRFLFESVIYRILNRWNCGVICGVRCYSYLLSGGVISFLAMCSWAVCKLPRWSTSNFDAVKSVAFLFARFRMDRWWWLSSEFL